MVVCKRSKNLALKRDEVRVSCDIVNLYPTVAINKAFDVLID